MPPGVTMTEIQRAIALLSAPGQVVELRALDVSTPDYRRPHTRAGYFNDPHKLAAEAAQVAAHAGGVYLTLNPVEPALLARAANRLKVIGERDPLTSDRNILFRARVLFDFDPVRPAGISSSQDEHQQAMQRAVQARAFLAGLGFPAPILADSGNGAHLLYFTHLPCDDHNLTKDLLEAAAAEFDDPCVKLDLVVHNPARISKVYGTVARKGDHTPERPHRLSRIVEAPESAELLSADLMRAAIEHLRKPAAGAKPARPPAASQPAGPGFNLAAWLAEKQLAVRGPKPWGDGGLMYTFDVCPFNPEHRGGSAFAGQLASGALVAGCHHASCEGKGWQDLRNLFETEKRGRPQQTPKAGEASKTLSQATQLVNLLMPAMRLFHTPDGAPYAAIQVADHREVHPVRSQRMREWAGRRYWAANGSVPGSQALQDALNMLAALALYEGVEQAVHTRLGALDGRLYLDLADADWRAVEIDPAGWRLVSPSPVLFRRPHNASSLPVPQAGGSLASLLSLFNLAAACDSRLLTAFLAGAFQLNGPFPILNFIGEQGTAKTTASKFIKSLLDPALPLLRSAPRNEQDLLLAAQNNHILVIDNLSRLPSWVSDALCRLSTGGGFGTRRLYSDDEEIVFGVQRPVIINGIPDLITRPDLQDRALILELAPIPDTQRRTEKELWAHFHQLHPAVLGAVLDLISAILRYQGQVQLAECPRMADFVVWASAAEPTLGWPAGTLLADYNHNHHRSSHLILSASSVARALLAYIGQLLHSGQSTWHGTLSLLFAALKPHVLFGDESFPSTPHHLSGELRRLAPTLRQQAVHLTFDERVGHTRERVLQIEFSGWDADAHL
jgi:hypothetical protein